MARRVLGDSDDITLRMRCLHANALYRDSNATLNDLSEAVETFYDTTQIARRVLGRAHPTVRSTEFGLGQSFARFRAFAETLKENDDPREAVEMLESVVPLWKRIYGEAHPETYKVEEALKDARGALAAASEER